MDKHIWEVAKNNIGRPRIFKTPESLWSACLEYFEWCDKNPLIEIDFKGKDAIEVNLPHPRAYTHSGLNVFLGVNHDFWKEMRSRAKENGEIEFSAIIMRVDEIMRTQKFEYAAAVPSFFRSGLLEESLKLNPYVLGDEVHNNL